MTLTPAGVLSGTPTQGGTFAFTVTAADPQGDSGSRNYSLQIACPTITVAPTSLPTDNSGTAYTPVTFTESGGIGAATFAESGALPTGMTFKAGVLSGTPTQTGSFPLQITTTDSASCTGSVSDTLTIYPVGGPQAMVPDNETITVSDTESLVPAIADIETITITDTEPSTPAVSDNESITVTDTLPYAPITITPGASSFNASSGAGTPGEIYGPVTFRANGDTGTLTISESGTLPAGLTFNNGTLAGTLSATSAGSYTFSVSASDVYGDQTAEQGYTLIISKPIPTLKISANPDSFTIAQGKTGETTLTFTPSGGYTGTLALSCSGLPANSACIFSQNSESINSLTLSGNNQAESVVLTFETDVNSQQAGIISVPSPQPPAAVVPALAIWFSSGLVGFPSFRRRRKMRGKNQR